MFCQYKCALRHKKIAKNLQIMLYYQLTSLIASRRCGQKDLFRHLGTALAGRRCSKNVSSSRSFYKSKNSSLPLLSLLQKYPFDKTRGKNKRATCAHILTWQIGLLLWLKVARVQTSAKHQMESSRHITKHLPGGEKKR